MVGALKAAAARGYLYTSFAHIESAPRDVYENNSIWQATESSLKSIVCNVQHAGDAYDADATAYFLTTFILEQIAECTIVLL
jgi:hypothetical protein